MVDVPAASTDGADPVADVLKKALNTKPKLDLEEAKYDEAVEVDKSDQGEDESTLPKYETHSIPKSSAAKPEAPVAKENADSDVIRVALLKFDTENEALKFLVNN